MITKVKNSIQTNSSPKEMFEYCSTKSRLGLDTETTGLDPFKEKIIMIQVGDENEQYIIDARKITKEVIDIVKSLAENKSILKVMQNAKFDYKMFRTNYDFKIANIADTMIQEMVLNTGRFMVGYGMDAMSRRYLNLALDKDVRTEFLKHPTNQPFYKHQIEYGAKDVWVPIKIHDFQVKRLEENGLTMVAQLENRFVSVVGDVEISGIYLNPTRWIELYKKKKIAYDECIVKLEEYVISSPKLKKFVSKQTDMFSDKKKTTVMWSSPAQMIPVFKALGIPTEVLDKDATKKAKEAEANKWKNPYELDVYKDSVEAKHLSKYKKKFEFVALYLEMKGYEKSISTYGEEFLNNINIKTGRVHSDFKQILDTGRMGCSNPNLQNIPKGSEYRDCFTSQKDDYLIIASDYANQEGRILASISGDKNMTDFFLNGDGDLHSHTARLMFKQEVSEHVNKHLRHIGKTLNFGIAYGMSAFKLSNDFEVSLAEAQDFIDKFYIAYPGLETYFKRKRQEMLENGFTLIDPVIGRKSYWSSFEKFKEMQETLSVAKEQGNTSDLGKGFWSVFFTAKGMAERIAQNYPIQGTAASMTKSACIKIARRFEEEGIADRAFIVNIIHDEIVCEAHKDVANKAAEIIDTCMVEAGKIFCPNIPTPVVVAVDDRWIH